MKEIQISELLFTDDMADTEKEFSTIWTSSVKNQLGLYDNKYKQNKDYDNIH